MGYLVAIIGSAATTAIVAFGIPDTSPAVIAAAAVLSGLCWGIVGGVIESSK